MADAVCSLKLAIIRSMGFVPIEDHGQYTALLVSKSQLRRNARLSRKLICCGSRARRIRHDQRRAFAKHTGRIIIIIVVVVDSTLRARPESLAACAVNCARTRNI
jgi:hypothetical protein